MQYDVCPEIKRILQIRRNERIIDDYYCPVTMCDFSNRIHIVHFQQGIGDGFKVDCLCRKSTICIMSCDGPLDICQIAGVDGINEKTPAVEVFVQLRI